MKRGARSVAKRRRSVSFVWTRARATDSTTGAENAPGCATMRFFHSMQRGQPAWNLTDQEMPENEMNF